MPEDNFEDVQPKPFDTLPLKDKLELVGVKIVPDDGAPDLYGVGETTDLFNLLTTVVNKIVNKDSFLDFNLVQKGFVAYTGAKDIPKELLYLTETELVILKEVVETGLKFEDPNKAGLEALVETIIFAGLTLVLGITQYTRKSM